MFSEGIERALRAAFAAHEGQLRKGADPVPYATHPVHAALIVARLGGDDETIQAAILHDVVEDCADWTLERVALEFGARVAAIVADLTEDKSKGWEERKQHAVDHAPRMRADAALVKAADKLHNLRTLLHELERATDSSAVWSRFRGGPERTLATARALVAALVPRVDARLARELEGVVERLAAAGAPPSTDPVAGRGDPD